VLKSPHSRRYRDCQSVLNFAERLECGAFTAAFANQAAHPTVSQLCIQCTDFRLPDI
jgi:hypothetical protein